MAHDTRRRRHDRGASPVDVARSLRPAGQDADAARVVHRHLRSYRHAAVAVGRLRRPGPARSSSRKRSTPPATASTDPDGTRRLRALVGRRHCLRVHPARRRDIARRARLCRARTAAAARGRSRSCRDCCARHCRCSVASWSASTTSAIVRQDADARATAISSCCSMRAVAAKTRAATISSSCVRSCVTHLHCAARRAVHSGQEDRDPRTSDGVVERCRARDCSTRRSATCSPGCRCSVAR